MTNGSNDRLKRIEAAIERTQRQLDEGFQKTQRQIDSNARVIEALSADIATTRASVDGLVQIIAEFSARSEVRLNRLDDAVVGIERILQELTRRNRNGNDHGDEF